MSVDNSMTVTDDFHPAVCERELIVGIVEGAIADLQGRSSEARRQAAVWLGSNRAGVWFDWLEIDQARILRAIGWPKVASQVLSNGALLCEREREILERGVAGLDG